MRGVSHQRGAVSVAEESQQYDLGSRTWFSARLYLKQDCRVSVSFLKGELHERREWRFLWRRRGRGTRGAVRSLAHLRLQ